MKQKRRALTLIEIIIALSVLSLCVGAFLFATPRAFSQSSFLGSVERLEATLAHAQFFSRRFQLPLQVQIVKQNGAYTAKIIAPPSVPSKWRKHLSKQISLSGVRTLLVDGTPTQQIELELHPKLMTSAVHTVTLSNGSIEKGIRCPSFGKEERYAPGFPQEIL